MSAADAADGLDPKDPDSIAANPPEKAVDPKQHFQVGANAGKWLEYDDRGVPIKNIKKKKPTKKEKDGLEAEYLEAKKKYQQYLKDVEAWEQEKLDAESLLEKNDKLRWAFRQMGADKQAPINVDDFEDLFRLMGWDRLSKKEVSNTKKGAAETADPIDLPQLRAFTNEQMPIQLLEDRLGGDVFAEMNLDAIYSPRTWRNKMEDEGGKKEKKEKKSKKDSKSPRGGSSPRGASSPRGKKEKRKDSKDASGSKSPRGSASPRSKKSDKDKKSKK